MQAVGIGRQGCCRSQGTGLKPRAQSAAMGAASFWLLRAKRSPEARVTVPRHRGDR